MNTLIYMWIEPLVMGHERCSEKLYFDVVIDGDYSELNSSEIEDIISGSIMYEIMDFANICQNWNYKVVAAKSTKEKPSINFAKTPEEIVKENKIKKFVEGKEELVMSKSDFKINNDGTINVSVPSLKLNEKINLPKMWESIEKNIIGKIKEGDRLILKDDFGNPIFEIWGGSFLNVAIGDVAIYDKKEMDEKVSIFNYSKGLKGGAFIRDDGRIDIGDFKRTFYLQVYTNNLIKSSLKLNKSLNELTSQKFLESGKVERINKNKNDRKSD